MTHRERILNVLNGRGDQNDRPPYFPDLSYYHTVRCDAGTMPEPFAGLSLLALHRRIDCGLPRHSMIRSSVRTTRADGSEKSTSMPRPSRLKSSITFSSRKLRPSLS